MKLSEDTLEIIGSIRTINAGSPVQGAVFKEGSVVKARRYKSAMPILRAEIDESWPRDFAVYDLKKFLSMWRLLDDPDVTFEDDYITFKSGRRKAKIQYVAPHLIEDPKFFDKEIAMPPTDFSFDLSMPILKSIRQAASTFAAPEIALISKGKGVILSTYNSKNPKDDRFEIEIGHSEDTFTAIISLEYLQFIPRDYTVNLSYKGIVKFESPNLSYFVTLSDKSSIKGK